MPNIGFWQSRMPNFFVKLSCCVFGPVRTIEPVQMADNNVSQAKVYHTGCIKGEFIPIHNLINNDSCERTASNEKPCLASTTTQERYGEAGIGLPHNETPVVHESD